MRCRRVVEVNEHSRALALSRHKPAAMASMPGLTPTFAEAVEFHKPSAEASAMFSAWYGFQHPGGEFEVCLRPGGVFYAPQFPANSRWCVMPSGDGAKIGIAWGKYGNYELAVTDAVLRELQGAAVPPSPRDAPGPNDWRRMRAIRPLSPAELSLIGATGGGSEWSFEYEGGAFNVQFRGDSYNHFVCAQYSAHSHWKLTNGDEVAINWGPYGNYALKVNGDAGAGSSVGNPKDWRRMKKLRDLEPAEASQRCTAHDHDHHG